MLALSQSALTRMLSLVSGVPACIGDGFSGRPAGTSAEAGAAGAAVAAGCAGISTVAGFAGVSGAGCASGAEG